MKVKKRLIWASACASFFLTVVAQFYFSDSMRRGEPFGPGMVLIALLATAVVAPLLWRYIQHKLRD